MSMVVGTIHKGDDDDDDDEEDDDDDYDDDDDEDTSHSTLYAFELAFNDDMCRKGQQRALQLYDKYVEDAERLKQYFSQFKGISTTFDDSLIKPSIWNLSIVRDDTYISSRASRDDWIKCKKQIDELKDVIQ